jgi:hypothetical protein
MIDVKTLMVVEVVVNGYLCVLMYFFRRSQKTYPGFGYWLACNAVLLTVYLLLALRGVLPDWLSISVALGLGVLAAVLRLEGIKHFYGTRAVWLPNLAVPILTVGVMHYFLVAVPSVLVRTVIFWLVVTVYLVRIASILNARSPREERLLCNFCAAFFVGYAGMAVFRIITWLLWPQERALFVATPSTILFFLSSVVFDIAWTTSFLALNGQRLAHELAAAQDQLAEKNCQLVDEMNERAAAQSAVERKSEELKNAFEEIKILSGIIPICMYCKKVRDDEGYWKQIEQFISSRSEAQFSHGICPKCLEEQYPAFAAKPR